MNNPGLGIAVVRDEAVLMLIGHGCDKFATPSALLWCQGERSPKVSTPWDGTEGGRWAHSVSVSSPALGGCKATLACPDILLPPKTEDTPGCFWTVQGRASLGPEPLLASRTWRKKMKGSILPSRASYTALQT